MKSFKCTRCDVQYVASDSHTAMLCKACKFTTDRTLQVDKCYQCVAIHNGQPIENGGIWFVSRIEDGIAYGLKPDYPAGHLGTRLAMSHEWVEVPREIYNTQACDGLAQQQTATRSSILEAAHKAVMQDREATHGDLEDQIGKIAQIWSVRLGRTITPEQVAIMMVDLKTVRAWGNSKHHDNWVDIAGYAACGGELADGA